MIVRISFLVVASVATFAVSQIKFNSSRKRKGAIEPSENDDPSFQQEGIEGEEEDKSADSKFSVEEKQEEEVGKKCRSTMKQNMKPNLLEKRDSESFEFSMCDNKLENVTETELLQKQEKELEQRKVTLEGKLLELCGLKEKKSYIAQLQRDLQAKKAETDMLNMTINLLQSERKELHEEIQQNLLAKKQLEITRKMKLEMQAKIGRDENPMMGQLMMMKEQISGFQREENSIRDDMVEKKLKAVKDVELEVAEMKRKNKELQLEKRELTVKLVAAQTRIIDLSNNTESKILANVEEEISSLRHANKHLSKKVEKLQKNRFGMIEELVYQRWLNACMKYEFQDYQTPSRKTSRHILGKNLSQASHEKTKQLLLDRTFDRDSSLTSSAEQDETDNTTLDSSSSSQRSIGKKPSLIQKIKRWGRSNDDSSEVSSPGKFSKGISLSRNGLIRRFSTSTIMSSGRKEVQDSTDQSAESPSFPRKRRVSFNDSVKTFTFQDMSKSIEGALDDNKIAELKGEKCELSASKLTFEKVVDLSDSSLELVCNDMVEAQMVCEVKVAHTKELHSRMPAVIPGDSKVEPRKVHFVTVFSFLLMLLVYFLLYTGGIY